MSLYRTVMGIDPGRTGGIAAIGIKSGLPRVWPMPESEERGCDVQSVDAILSQVTVKDTLVYLEWNNARPHEVPDFAMRAGLQLGQIDALLYARGFSKRQIVPQKWTGYFGLPGKTFTNAIPIRARFFDEKFPAFTKLIRGPRGGIQDGLLDALLIAYYGWVGESQPFGHKGGRKAITIRE
jgi:hypothetical protein